MRGGRVTCLVLLVVVANMHAGIGPASAAACTPPPPTCRGADCRVDGRLCGGGPGRPRIPIGEPGPTGARQKHPPVTIYVPTCPGNTPGGTGDLCEVATTSCPTPTDFRYWVYVQTWDADRKAYGEPVLRTAPPFVCAGPEEVAEADPRAAVLARVRAEWQTFGLPGSEVVVEPADDTLVGASTRFSTDSPQTLALPPKQILGLGVTLTITASGYRWDFGDGTGAETGPAGRQVEHVYRLAGPKQVSVRTYYTATFTVEGDDAVYPLQGTADVPGPAEDLAAREARTQLEDG